MHPHPHRRAQPQERLLPMPGPRAPGCLPQVWFQKSRACCSFCSHSEMQAVERNKSLSCESSWDAPDHVVEEKTAFYQLK
jgi:hypothetical protein